MQTVSRPRGLPAGCRAGLCAGSVRAVSHGSGPGSDRRRPKGRRRRSNPWRRYADRRYNMVCTVILKI
jgi:hypothetical protein